MTDEFEKINFDEMFEQTLVRDHMENPTPDKAAELLELAAAHKTNSLSYEMTEELRQYLIDCAQEYAQGTSVEKDGTAGVVESTKAASDVYTPISGEIVDTNQAIVDDPSKINQDPENSAWFFKLKVKDKSEMDSLMNKEDYDKFAKESST